MSTQSRDILNNVRSRYADFSDSPQFQRFSKKTAGFYARATPILVDSKMMIALAVILLVGVGMLSMSKNIKCTTHRTVKQCDQMRKASYGLISISGFLLLLAIYLRYSKPTAVRLV